MKICVVTGSRADYGLLLQVLKEIDQSKVLELQLLVTGSHLSPLYGETWRVIESDGFTIDGKVDLGLNDDDPVSVTDYLGKCVTGCGKELSRLKPDMLLVLGDRYEILAAAETALILSIPVAHIAGGDVTEGAFDDAIRHSITKMSHLHFATTEGARQRIVQMGETAENVITSGSPGIDNIVKTTLLNEAEVGERLGAPLLDRNLLVTYHPATLSATSASEEVEELLAALQDLPFKPRIIFTGVNADPGNRQVNEAIKKFVEGEPRATYHDSLGQQLYYSVMKFSDAVVGNSSSGLYEAPSLKVPTVNIGDRQTGRELASSVITCHAERSEITASIMKVLDLDLTNLVNPYGNGDSAKVIVNALESVQDPRVLLKKRFVSHKV